MSRRGVLAAIVCVVVGLSGCTAPDLGADLAKLACQDKALDQHKIQQGIALPPDFVPVAAKRCVFTSEFDAERGLHPVRIEEQAEGDLTALVAALKEPNQFATNVVCPYLPQEAMVITLVNEAGLQVTPTPPTGPCGEANPSVLIAVQVLSWAEVTRTPLGEFAPAFSPATECPPVLKPVVAIAAGKPDRPAPTGPTLFPDGRGLMICHYALYPAAGGDLRDGRPDAVTRLGGAPLEKFRAAVAAAPPITGTCDRPQPNTVLIFPEETSSHQAVTVEVGGCFRMLDAVGNLRQLDATAIALFTVNPFALR